MADIFDLYRNVFGGGNRPQQGPPQSYDVGSDTIPLSLDRTPVNDPYTGTALHQLMGKLGDIGTAIPGLAERAQLGGMNALGMRQSDGDIYRSKLPVAPGVEALGDAATFATGGLASGLAPAAGIYSQAARYGARAALPVARGLWADEFGGIRAFHGSPHSFPAEPNYPLGRFDPNKIGTGEGAQAYGHGMPYLAEAEPVAETYLRDANWLYGGRKAQTIYDRLNNTANERGLDNIGWDKLNAQRGFWEKVSLGQSPRSIIDEARANPDWFGKAELDYIQSLDPNKFKRTGGHMYEVDVHADPQQFLDWDKALTEQSPQVRDVLASLDDKLSGMSLDLRPGQTARGQHAYSTLARGSSLDYGAGQVSASRELKELGVPGIRYLDQASRDIGNGTSNYVMFDPSLVEIRRKYGLLPPLAGGGLLATQQEQQ